ncbi:formate dehydrogenase accessory sulfurtransferase FdhD [Ferrimicrobium acidiphilum]|uniref:Sulfur carrier protein FdhD n=1 Tax=Ferrimicrobium acidiphilum DSM 19497 TaxID=1121877 RepID=A0A0D8FX74_9ACTN|nr:formate dehydrogenase accessory sulfurtransferase FdhD [Ferrimicrobium acidiphilum]KJE76867.1 protein FdhD [Ferrimicrobium acidiphilum DSM 19497]
MPLAHSIETRRIIKFTDGVTSVAMDSLIQEEPLVIDVEWPGTDSVHFTTTMRTPGDDFALAIGILATESGITKDDIRQTRYCVGPGNIQDYNKVTVALRKPVKLQPSDLRPVSCGWCGTADLVDRLVVTMASSSSQSYQVRDVLDLFDEFDQHQKTFQATGASHAALLKPREGEIIMGEDVGRHNALDKAIGHAILDGVSLANGIALLSGRAGSDLVLKAARAGLSHIASVSAPTALAVELANQAGITLLGFVRSGRLNLYTHAEGLEETYDATRVLR